MKKIFAVALALALVLALAPAALAEVDLSGMTFDELVALREQINLAIWNCEEWQEVTVPQGVWQVGTQIPAGKWTIKAAPKCWCTVKVGTKLENGGSGVDYDFMDFLYAPDSNMYNEGNKTELTVELTEGQYVEVNMGNTIFMPYHGGQDLGFK